MMSGMKKSQRGASVRVRILSLATMSQSYPSQPAQYGTQYPAYPAGGYPSPYAQTPPTPYTDFTPGHSKSDQAAPQNENYLSPPDLSSITPRVASKTIQRLIASQLRDAEFDSAHPDALQRLELEVVTCQSLVFFAVGRRTCYLQLRLSM